MGPRVPGKQVRRPPTSPMARRPRDTRKRKWRISLLFRFFNVDLMVMLAVGFLSCRSMLRRRSWAFRRSGNRDREIDEGFGI